MKAHPPPRKSSSYGLRHTGIKSEVTEKAVAWQVDELVKKNEHDFSRASPKRELHVDEC